MTVDSVTQILNKIPADKWEKVTSGRLVIPWPLREEIQRRYSTDTEKNHACADYYVNCHPDAELEHLTVGLYIREEYALARESKSFMSTGKINILPLNNINVATDACVILYTDILVSSDESSAAVSNNWLSTPLYTLHVDKKQEILSPDGWLSQSLKLLSCSSCRNSHT